MRRRLAAIRPVVSEPRRTSIRTVTPVQRSHRGMDRPGVARGWIAALLGGARYCPGDVALPRAGFRRDAFRSESRSSSSWRCWPSTTTSSARERATSSTEPRCPARGEPEGHLEAAAVALEGDRARDRGAQESAGLGVEQDLAAGVAHDSGLAPLALVERLPGRLARLARAAGLIQAALAAATVNLAAVGQGHAGRQQIELAATVERPSLRMRPSRRRRGRRRWNLP